MAKPKKKTTTKSKKLPLTVTVRLNEGPRQKLRDISLRDGISENALVQQLVDRYLDKLDLGPRVDKLEEQVVRLEGALSLAGALANSVLRDPSLLAQGNPPPAEPDDDEDDVDDDDHKDDEVIPASLPADTSEDDEDAEDDEDDEDEDEPASLLDKVG